MRSVKLIVGAVEIMMAYYFMSLLSVQWAIDFTDKQTIWSLPLMVSALTLFCAVIMIATRKERGKDWDIAVCVLSALVALVTMLFVPVSDQGKVRLFAVVINVVNLATSITSMRIKSAKGG